MLFFSSAIQISLLEMMNEDATLPETAVGRKEGKVRGKSPVMPRYRRASTGSCHDFCKHGGTHQFQKSVTIASSKQLKPSPRRSSATTTPPVAAQKKKKKEKPASFSGNSRKVDEADVKEKTLYMITPAKPRNCSMKKKSNNNLISETQSEIIMLRHHDSKNKKLAVHGLFNDVIESTARKLAKTRKSKVKALVGAFETVISLQETKSSPPLPPAESESAPAPAVVAASVSIL